MLHKKSIKVSSGLKNEIENLSHNLDTPQAKLTRIGIRKALCKMTPRDYEDGDRWIQVSGISDELKEQIETIAKEIRVAPSTVMKVFLYISMNDYPEHMRYQKY